MTQLTQAEYDQLKEQLAQARANLKQAEQDKAKAHISAGDPDMHENAAAEQAYEEIRKWAGEVERLKRIANQASVVDGPKDASIVQLGSVVTMKVGGENVTKVMSGPQGRWDKGQVSIDSKVGKAIIGQPKGYRVTYESPAGPIEVEVVEIALPVKVEAA